MKDKLEINGNMLQKLMYLGNFYMFMPGGYYRDAIAECSSGKIQVMAAIDQLLESEFAELDVVSIMKVIRSIHTLIMNAVEEGASFKKEEFMKEEIDTLNREKNKLQPLFDRLVKIGFSPALLMR